MEVHSDVGFTTHSPRCLLYASPHSARIKCGAISSKISRQSDAGDVIRGFRNALSYYHMITLLSGTFSLERLYAVAMGSYFV